MQAIPHHPSVILLVTCAKPPILPEAMQPNPNDSSVILPAQISDTHSTVIFDPRQTVNISTRQSVEKLQHYFI